MKKTVVNYLFIIGLLVCMPSHAGSAAIAAATTPSATTTEVISEADLISPELLESLKSPRATMRTFITAMHAVHEGEKSEISKAVSTLDLSKINDLISEKAGNDLAYILYSTIENGHKLTLKKIPTNAKNSLYTYAKFPEGKIEISKQKDGRWLFTAETLANLPVVLESLIKTQKSEGKEANKSTIPFHVQLRSKLPESLKQGFILEYWQWLGLFIIVFIGSLADKFLAWVLARNVRRWKKHSTTIANLEDDILRPLGLMAMALIWWTTLDDLGLPSTAMIILSVAVKLLVSLSGVWSAFRLVDILNVILMSKARRTGNKFDDLFVPMISKTLKVFIVIIGFIFIADNLNVNVSSLLAGLGIGGLAFAFASKDLLGNFFGSVTVLLDRPFNIGDWVVVGDVEGNVEEVGFRSTRIRTFYNSLITLPNSILTNTKIDNMGARRYRRMKTNLSLTYDTSPEKIDAFCEGIRSLIRLHPYMRKDYYHVYFNAYSSASLDILVYVFWATPDWAMELRERHRFLLDILRLARQLDVEFAYPTQTIHLKQEKDSVPPDHSQHGFQEIMTEEQAFAMGKEEAEAIFDVTLGKGNIPGPVNFR